MRRLVESDLDVLIIGGGITGCGAAREAARRGLKVGLVEQADLASGTSSRSSRLVHGGLRYLEHLELGLVFEAVSERRVLQDIAPHLVTPLGFLFPVYKSSRRGRFTVEIGMWLYDALSLFRSPKRHRSLSISAVAREEPALDRRGMTGASLYYDCATDDARLTLETALDARASSAEILTYVRAVGLVEEGGRVVGVELRDALSGETLVVRAGAVINATGPWTDGLRAGRPPLLRPTKGVHIVVERERLPVQYADVLLHPEDGRVLFAIPWGDRAYIGTTDTFYDGDPAEVAADADDVAYLLGAAARFYPGAGLGPDDVLSTWAGLRPLIGDGAEDASSVSREHSVVVEPNGLVTIAGGKLTTYRRMAIEVVEAAVGLLRLTGRGRQLASSGTDEHPLPGGVGWPDDDDIGALTSATQSASGDVMDAQAASRLVGVYGARAPALAERIGADPALGEPLSPCGPELLAEVDWACAEEMAERLTDVLRRRTHVALTHREQGLDCCERVAARMAKHLGWSDRRRAEEVSAYRAEIARTRAWRDG
jgi:glycerol-3-phosphate dehydrogenase